MITLSVFIMKWKEKIIDRLIKELKSNSDWSTVYNKLILNDFEIGIHLAIFTEPYLSLLLDGKKTIESRFSINRVSPFGRVNKGDIVVIKKAGGLVVGFFLVDMVEYTYNMNVRKLKIIEQEYGDKICSTVDPDFWKLRENSKYVTLIGVNKVIEVEPFNIEKSDRIAWVVIKEKALSLFVHA